MADDVDDAGAEINPVSTKSWWTFSRQLSLEERGFAVSVMALMAIEGWHSLGELPSIPKVAALVGIFDAEVERLWPVLAKIPEDIRCGQINHIRRYWPDEDLKTFAPEAMKP